MNLTFSTPLKASVFAALLLGFWFPATHGAPDRDVVPGTRMRVDWPRLIGQQDIVLPQLPETTRDGLLMGNGDIGTALYGTPGVIALHVGKNDIWDYRDPMDAKFRGHTHKEFLEKYADPEKPAITGYRSESDSSDDMINVEIARTWHTQMPTSKPAGKIRFRSSGRVEDASSQEGSARADLWNAEVTFARDKTRPPVFRTFVAYPRNVIVAEYSPSGVERFDIELVRHKDTTGLIPNGPEFGASGRDIWLRYRFPADPATYPDGFEYVMYGRVLGADEIQSETNDKAYSITQECRGRPVETSEGIAVAHVRASSPVTLLVAVATTRDDPDPFRRAQSLVQATETEGLTPLRDAHRKYWHDYWQRSLVILTGKSFLNQQWYVSQYLLACSWRAGKVAPGLFGCWAWQDFPHFGNDYHWDYNMQQAVWGAYSSNHLEQTVAYDEAALALLPTARREAEERYGLDGAKFFLISYPRKYRYNPFPYVHTDQMMSLNGWVAQPLWWRYQYSQDVDYLRARAYPLMRACARFYEGYLTRADDGKYDIWPTAAWDVMLFPHLVHNKNCALDLGLIRFLMKACVEASEVLGVDGERRIVWKRIADNLRDYPTTDSPNGKVFSAFEGANPGFHFPVIGGPIFPGEDVGLHTPAPLRQIAERTIFPKGYVHDGEWVLTAMAHVRLGKNVLEHYEQSTRITRLPNGGLFIINAQYSLWVHAFGWPIVINESIVQSYTGNIRIVPVKLGVAVRFARLRTVGAFLVSGEIDAKSRVAYLAITSEAGRRCELIRPWAGAVRIRELESLKVVSHTESDVVLSFATVAGATYVLDRPDEPWEERPLVDVFGN